MVAIFRIIWLILLTVCTSQAWAVASATIENYSYDDNAANSFVKGKGVFEQRMHAYNDSPNFQYQRNYQRIKSRDDKRRLTSFFVFSDGLFFAKGGDNFVDLTTPARRRHILDGDATGGGHRPGTGRPGDQGVRGSRGQST